MTPQQIEMALETIALVLEDLKKTQEKQQSTITAIEETLQEHAMREVQRLGQEIEQEQLISDRINYGMSVTQGGKRIDPMSIYKEPEQEPVAWLDGPHLVVRSDMRDRLNYKGPWVDLGRAIPDKWTPLLFTTPPQRKPLTNGEIYTAYITATNQMLRAQDERLAFAFARAIEAAHGIKENT